MLKERLVAPLDQPLVWRRYERAAQTAKLGVIDPLAREVDLRMQERLDYVRINPQNILDLGSGQGASAAALKQRYPEATLLLMDAVSTLLPSPVQSSAWRKYLGLLNTRLSRPVSPLPVCGDARQIPLSSKSQGLVWANLLLPWVDDHSAVFEEAHRVLETGGLFMFSTLGPDTLKELAACFGDAYPHRHSFADMHDIGDLLGQSGFADPVVDMEVITVQYGQLKTLLQDLRRAAATSSHVHRSQTLPGHKGLRGRSAWESVATAWQNLAVNGSTSVSFEVIYGHAWSAARNTLADGRSVIQFDPGARAKR